MLIEPTTLMLLRLLCGGYIILFIVACIFHPEGGIEVFKWTFILTSISFVLFMFDEQTDKEWLRTLGGGAIFWFMVTSAVFMVASVLVSIGDNAFDDTPRGQKQRSAPKSKRTPSVEIVYGEVVEEAPRDHQLGNGIPRLTKVPYSNSWWKKKCGGIPVYDGMKYRQSGECPVSRRGHWHGLVGDDEICEDC